MGYRSPVTNLSQVARMEAPASAPLTRPSHGESGFKHPQENTKKSYWSSLELGLVHFVPGKLIYTGSSWWPLAALQWHILYGIEALGIHSRSFSENCEQAMVGTVTSWLGTLELLNLEALSCNSLVCLVCFVCFVCLAACSALCRCGSCSPRPAPLVLSATWDAELVEVWERAPSEWIRNVTEQY